MKALAKSPAAQAVESAMSELEDSYEELQRAYYRDLVPDREAALTAAKALMVDAEWLVSRLREL